VYQYYFATERGHLGYAKFTRNFARLIWSTASPRWSFDDATFERGFPPGSRRFGGVTCSRRRVLSDSGRRLWRRRTGCNECLAPENGHVRSTVAPRRDADVEGLE
jgi:hypothetical protein